MRRVLVTGATGFVGRSLCTTLSKTGCLVRAAVRKPTPVPEGVSEAVVVGDIGSQTLWDEAVRDVDCVIHAAARAHILHDAPSNAGLYAETNAHGTRWLAQCAARAGVRRFVFVSSIKVNGEETVGRPYRASDEPQPRDPYGMSKLLGERAAREVASRTAMEVAIVRPPLVYGPGVRANFLRLMRWVDQQRPLPLGAVNNRRSLVSVWNLCDLLSRLATNSSSSPGIWLVSDDEDLSTPDVVRRLATAMGRKARLIPVPVFALRWMGALSGHGAEVARLCGSLVCDIAPTRETLGWLPPLTVDESMARTVEWYLREGRSGGK
jgi:UDP-4-keto-D-QuiNAc 4-reductase